MKLSVVIPYRPTSPERERLLPVVLTWLNEIVTELDLDATVTLADDPHPDFNRGRALNAGVAQTDGELLAFVDADLIISGGAFRMALQAVENGDAMVLPFSNVVALDRIASTLVRQGAEVWGPWGGDDIQYTWDRSTGGINIVTRATFEAVGGFDPRFSGWGYEDTAFAAAIETLVGPVEWVAATAIHLWHPVDPTRNGELPNAGKELCERFAAARGDKEAMQALIGSR